MTNTNILVICSHQQIMETILRLINQNGNWEASGSTSDEEAIDLFQKKSYDIVLLGSGIEEKSEEKLRSFFTSQNTSITIIQHFGGGSGLLSNEIQEALDKRGKDSVGFID